MKTTHAKRSFTGAFAVALLAALITVFASSCEGVGVIGGVGIVISGGSEGESVSVGGGIGVIIPINNINSEENSAQSDENH